MSIKLSAGADLARQAQLQSRMQLLQAQRLLIRATAQDGASDAAERLDSELGREAEELSSELKAEKARPWEPGSEVKRQLFRPRTDTLELSARRAPVKIASPR